MSLLVFSSCYKEEDYKQTNFKESDVITSVTSSKSVMSANNRDECMIQVILPNDAEMSTMVELTTTKGVFSGTDNKSTLSVPVSYKVVDGSVKIVAQATLVAGLKTGDAIVSAKVGGFSSTVTIALTRNYPISLSVIPDSVSIAANPMEERLIQVSAGALSGGVSDGQKIVIRAIDPITETDLGVFRTGNEKFTSNQSVTFNYALMPDLIHLGEIWIIATTEADTPSATVSDTISIYSY